MKLDLEKVAASYSRINKWKYERDEYGDKIKFKCSQKRHKSTNEPFRYYREESKDLKLKGEAKALIRFMDSNAFVERMSCVLPSFLFERSRK